MNVRPNLTRAITSPELLPFTDHWVIASRVMRGVNITVWRTDGASGPMPLRDQAFIASTKWRLDTYTNVRCQFSPHCDTTYEIIAMRMPTIAERRVSEEQADRFERVETQR